MIIVEQVGDIYPVNSDESEPFGGYRSSGVDYLKEEWREHG